MLLQDENGQIQPSHSISAGLDYPGVGPEHAYLAETGRVHYGVILRRLCFKRFPDAHQRGRNHSCAGILPCRGLGAGPCGGTAAGGDVLVNLSGRGDKDLGIVKKIFESLSRILP